jgi:hypothetical protein
MKFYDYKLQEITVPKFIDWNNLPQDDNFGLQTQLVHTLSTLNIDKKFCVVDSDHGLNFINLYSWMDTINNSDIDTLVINTSDHPAGIKALYKDYIEKDVLILNSDFNESIYYPFWMLASRDWAKDDVIDLVDQKPYSISFVNGKPRSPRVYIMHQLIQKSYVNNIDITWAPLDCIPDTKSKIEYVIENIHGSQMLEFADCYSVYENFFKIAPTFVKIRHKYGYFNAVRDISNGVNTGYLQVISESRPELSGFVSEKIFKAVRGAQLFLIQGSPGTVAYLRSQGFDTFDDYIDHNRYDHEPNWIKRTDLMLSVLDDIFSNIETIYFDTVERRAANRQVLLNTAFDLFKR